MLPAEEPHRREHPRGRQGHARGRQAPRLRGEPRVLQPPGLDRQLLSHLPERPEHLAQDRQDLERQRRPADGGHAVPRTRPPSSSPAPAGRPKPSRSSSSRPRPRTERGPHPHQDGVDLLPDAAPPSSTRTPRPCSTPRWWTSRPPSAAPTCASPATPTTWAARDANVRLSRARADAVAQYLMTKGFERTSSTWSATAPTSRWPSNDSDAGRAKNRRTDFEVIAR